MSVILSDEEHEVEVDLYVSEHLPGKLTLHIDTTGIPETLKGPALRIVLNDDFENPIWDYDNESIL